MDLLARVRAGDELAFSELFERYHPRLIRWAGTFAGRRDLVEDIAQETWLAVLRGVDRFEGRSSFKTWLFQICANRARSIAVREHRIVPVDDVTRVADQPVFAVDGSWETPPVRGAAAAGDRAELLDAVQTAILALPFTQRQVITLRDIEGLAAEAVCEVLMLTDGNQRVLLHRARLRVRAALGREVS